MATLQERLPQARTYSCCGLYRAPFRCCSYTAARCVSCFDHFGSEIGSASPSSDCHHCLVQSAYQYLAVVINLRAGTRSRSTE